MMYQVSSAYKLNYFMRVSINSILKYAGFKLEQCRVVKKMGEFGGQNAHSTLNTDCESGV